MQKLGIPLIVLFLFPAITFSQLPPLEGPEFQVNSYTTSDQDQSVVSLDGSGGFVVVWSSAGGSGTDNDLRSVQGQRMSPEGSPIGSQFQINTTTSGLQRFPAVASQGTDGFVVVWTSITSAGSDGDLESIQGQRYDSAGFPLSGEFQVNSYTTSEQSFPSVGILDNGQFLVAWRSSGSSGTDSDGTSVQAQTFDSSGNIVGSEFQVNQYTTGVQDSVEVAALADGRFVVVWSSPGSFETDADFSIQARRFDSLGNGLGAEFQVNAYTTLIQASPSVVADSNGGFAVVWRSQESDGDDPDQSIQVRRFDSLGLPQGMGAQVNAYTTSVQSTPSISFSGDHFLVVWKSDGSGSTDSDGESIQGQFADENGILGEQFQVNSYTPNDQIGNSVAPNGDGGFVVVWTSDGSNGLDQDLTGLLAQRVDPPLFTDGFESGDTSAWSSVQF